MSEFHKDYSVKILLPDGGKEQLATLRTRRTFVEQLSAHVPFMRDRVQKRENEEQEAIIYQFLELLSPAKTESEVMDWLKNYQRQLPAWNHYAECTAGSTTGWLDHTLQDAFIQRPSQIARIRDALGTQDAADIERSFAQTARRNVVVEPQRGE